MAKLAIDNCGTAKTLLTLSGKLIKYASQQGHLANIQYSQRPHKGCVTSYDISLGNYLF